MLKTTAGKIFYLKLCVVVLAIAAYFYVPGVHEFIETGFTYLKHRDFRGLREFILSYGLWAPVMSIALRAFQSIVPLVPGLAITITNAWIFGWQYGAFYTWIGSLLGATLDFGIARWYGRPVVEGFINVKYLDLADHFFKKNGILAVFVTRLILIIPFKVISYGAGFTAIPLSQFAIATAIGQTPAIILYSFLGQNIVHSLKTAIVSTSVLMLMGFIFYYYRGYIQRFLSSLKKN